MWHQTDMPIGFELVCFLGQTGSEWRSVRTTRLTLTGVCTENLIRVDDVMESPKLRNDRAALFRSGRPGLAIQVEGAA
jgi:hypothetical protein